MNTGTPPATSEYYAILVTGRLDACWSEWFGGLKIAPAGAEQDHTLLHGPVADQAALHGILDQIGSLGLTLIAVYRLVNEAGRPDPKVPGSPIPAALSAP